MMSDNIIIESKDRYIHVHQYGPISYDTSLDAWLQIIAACKNHHCFNILGETFTTNALSIIEAFDFIEIFRLVGVTHKHRIAWVHQSDDPENITGFIESALKNRGLVNGHFFLTVKQAKKWLLDGPYFYLHNI